MVASKKIFRDFWQKRKERRNELRKASAERF
jgi:hypothetical protein